MPTQRTIHRVIFASVTLLGGVVGGLGASAAGNYMRGLAPLTYYATYSAFVVFGMVLGVLLAPSLSSLLTQSINGTVGRLQKTSLGEAVLGSLGLVIGLGVAFFISLGAQSLQLGVLRWIEPLVILGSVLGFGSLGVHLGFRLASLPHTSRAFQGQVVEERNRVLIDTSIIVDGRLEAVLETGFLQGTLVVPEFVLGELQMLADSEDALRRVRGRRGLESLEKLRGQYPFEVLDEAEGKGADQKLIRMAKSLKAALLTNDYNLQKVAAVHSIRVLNLNQLAAALRPSVLPGQMLHLSLQREGKESHQAVAHFEDGTMVVVERGRPHIGKEVIGEVTSVMQTATGKMVFARFRQLVEAAPAEPDTQEATAVDNP